MQSKDLALLLELGKQEWSNEDWLTLEYLKASYNQEGAHYVALYEEKIIGGILLVRYDIVKNWIRYLIVDKHYRKKGIGASLVEKALHHIPNGESVFVDTGVTDKPATKFYEKMGFKNKGMVRGLYGKTAAYFFKKNIS